MAGSRAREIRPRLVGQNEGDRAILKTGLRVVARGDLRTSPAPGPGPSNVPGRSHAAVSLKSPVEERGAQPKAKPTGLAIVNALHRQPTFDVSFQVHCFPGAGRAERPV
jgi:hypothetical protein